MRLAASAWADDIPQSEWTHSSGNFDQVPESEPVIGSILETGTHRVARDASDWPDGLPSWAPPAGVQAYAAEPMIHRDEVVGVIGVFAMMDIGAAVEEGRVWLRMFADQAAAAVANAQAFEEIERLQRQLAHENEYLREEVRVAHSFGEIVGESSALRKNLEQIELVAPTNASVLILGESGTGKELMARAIHEHSSRRGRPLIKVNCASVPRDLFESEFFGHVQGAFTGAQSDRQGRFQLADGGTLFLDEVGEIPLELQGKLLRVLQEGTFERLGEEVTTSVDVRILAATNRDLSQAVTAREFREDLYFRLSVFPLELVPLRERPEDIPSLAEHFVKQAARELGCKKLVLKRKHIEMLQTYSWPGNVRELQNVIERAAISARCGDLRFDIPRDSAAPPPAAAPTPSAPGRILTYAELKTQERDNLVAALEQSNWKVSGSGGAADLLGVNPTTLASRIKAMGIERPK